jgi:glycosyltransferase involved in cell wall biosynthesis
MKLLIAIPALNEEESIASIIERCLEAKQEITSKSQVTSVEITVVSDGSTDQTVEIAEGYTDRVNLIIFERNRGYGAAIKEAWSNSDAELLGFLDADGTCDPLFFTNLCSTLVDEDADVVLGCRLNPNSKMPLVRRIGNTGFATLLSLFSSTRVKDTASGMRVVRREHLPNLLPLPNGLHFTPAMSARAMLNGKTKIIEITMPYEEREGESKLHVLKDGLRFLRVIVDSAMLYRPSRPMGILAIIFLLISGLLMLTPTVDYIQTRTVAEWMIYRFIVANLLGTAAVLLLSGGFLAKSIISTTEYQKVSIDEGLLVRGFRSGWFWFLPLVLFALGGGLVFSSAMQLIETGMTFEHWSRFVLMSFLVQVGLIASVTWIIDYTLNLIRFELSHRRVRSK